MYCINPDCINRERHHLDFINFQPILSNCPDIMKNYPLQSGTPRRKSQFLTFRDSDPNMRALGRLTVIHIRRWWTVYEHICFDGYQHAASSSWKISTSGSSSEKSEILSTEFWRSVACRGSSPSRRCESIDNIYSQFQCSRLIQFNSISTILEGFSRAQFTRICGRRCGFLRSWYKLSTIRCLRWCPNEIMLREARYSDFSSYFSEPQRSDQRDQAQ